VRFIDTKKARIAWMSMALMAAGVALISCSSTPLPPPPPPPPPPRPVTPPAPPPPVLAPAPPPVVAAPPAGPAQGGVLAEPTDTVRDWKAYQVRAARRIMQANPQATFSGKVPDPLASIPVMTVRLNRDGSVREVEVMRTPKFYPETVELARQAILRAAPYGNTANLSGPAQFNQVFLYNDALKFQLDALQPGRQ
jgi:hypothetical protein